jgi:serine protease inhibitor
MVLVNALYFRGPWENKFHGRLTQKVPFHVTEEKTVDVDMMQTEDYFPVTNIDILDAKAIVLPYEVIDK